MKLLFKLLRQNISIGQILGFVLVNLLGGIIVLAGVQGYSDFKSFSNSGDRILSSGHLVITKPVKSILADRPVFSENEIDDLKELSAVSSVGEFVASQVEVKAAFALGLSRISSDIFLEAVPDEFIKDDYSAINDDAVEWSAGLDSEVVPLILPRNYLNLYNYGFATANGLPQITDDLLGTFPMVLTFETDKGKVRYNAVVCGLTNKINTILAPWDFIEKLNGEYAPDADTRPSRLIITTDAEEFEDSFFKYLEDKGYVVEGDSSHVQLQSFVYGILFVIIAVGFLFSLLAFFLLVVSIMLLLEKNKEKIVNLFSLGYSIRRISRVYQLTVLVIDAFVWILAASVTTILYPRFATMMQDASPEFVPATLWQIWGLALILIILFSLLHGVVVYRQVRKHCKIK
jgi:hypothetical protein